ncbi:MAG: hypothetical protein HN353_01445 [Bdellovibrionales bacterium]|jgi:hypothetical protein|nr:hypothetical protein [Bdellovibrionales bacterium]MBT3525455.1 hypothetical protein [Bdellovibrionales bacterium]MBT7670556.1 hypothetical protein [Bdellovibrionales bacterium]MBT7767662.1 hypothetical protein [Bdellovibrionales bacterium]
MIVLWKNISVSSATLLAAIILLGCSGVVWASSPAGLVNYTRGVVFAIEKGNTRMIKKGDNIFPGSELITEMGGQLSYTDYFDHRYHLSGSGQIKIVKGEGPQLKRGHLWIQSYHRDQSFTVKTANGQINYTTGEAVISFDPGKGKSQAVVLKGEMQFHHLVYRHLGVTLREGEFSQVDGEDLKEGETSYPRNPTRVGYKSFQKLLSLFDGAAGVIKSEMLAQSPTKKVVKKRENSGRGVASISTPATPTKDSTNGKITYWRSLKPVAARTSKAKVKQLAAPNKLVKVFGNHPHNTYQVKKTKVKAQAKVISRKKVKKRTPASVSNSLNKKLTPFERSLQGHTGRQMRHKKEVNTLIDDLKSYSQDYRQGY